MSNRHDSPEEIDRFETREWLDSLRWVLEERGPERAAELLRSLQTSLARQGISLPARLQTPYVNTISRALQPRFPGRREIERRIKSIIRWNAMAMVVRANRESEGIGGHISTYASAATLYEVGFNHFFRGPDHPEGGDHVYFQGHASPGIYARAFLEGRLDAEQLHNFRRELRPAGGLSSYPHPWLMPDFWSFPTVSMGLGPLMAIYQARFNRYLEDRGLAGSTGRVWAFCGDGEMDEPESLGAISLAGRYRLDNLVFVINCNLQRLDGPVRGNGKIIQELETVFRGAGWNVIKVIWGDSWDPLLEQDTEGALVARMEEAVDGDYQKYTVSDGSHIRKQFFGTDPRVLRLVENLSDEEIHKLRRGGHDPEKVYAAYQAATEHRGSPTVILAKTIKGYGMGEAGEGKNITHSQKKLNEEELREFRTRFGIPISDEDVGEAPFYRPAEDSEEIAYLRERRQALGGCMPCRQSKADALPAPAPELLGEFLEGSEGREVSTTMGFVKMLGGMLQDETLGPRIVPIVPDEARTFGMEALFRQVGIYSPVGQKYEPVDREKLLYYKEATNGQILEEGITEAGSMSSFIAAGTSYSTQGLAMLPMYIFYSMFGFQRIGDLVWAAADMRCRGFLFGATSGRTTLAGEGLQHQDGNSHLLALPVPNVETYDPAYAYELAVIIEDGIRRMLTEQEDVLYYVTIENEPYAMPPMPEGVRDGILSGLYTVRTSEHDGGGPRVSLMGSGAILNEALKAASILEERYDVAADVLSATSYKALHRNALETERRNRLNPKAEPERPYVTRCFENAPDAVVAASDYVKALPYSISHWIPAPFCGLGTDGFGRSEARAELRDFFEVDARHIASAALSTLAGAGKIDAKVAEAALGDLEIDREVDDPVRR